MIMLNAMASIHPVDPVRNGTALAIIKATLRAQAYSAIVPAVPVAPRAAAIENPRLMIALIVVIDPQKTNGTVILNPMIWADSIRYQESPIRCP
jgi:hypothetical protein